MLAAFRALGGGFLLGSLGTLAVMADGPDVMQLKKLSLEELMNVEVTSVARYPEKLRDAAAAIQVITSEDIQHSAAFSIPEALRLAPNLQVAQKNPHDWGISARGFNAALANKLLVMIDGRSVYTPLFSGVFWDVQDYVLEDVDRIEVISGPGGTLWGANAVNGVINITTKNAKETQGLFLETGGGTELRDFASVRYGTRVAPNAYLRVYGKFSDRDSAVSSTGTDLADAWSMRRGGFRFDADLPMDSAATLQGDIYSGSEYVVTGGIQKVAGGNVLGRWSRSLGANSDMSLKLYYDRTHLVDPITNQFGPTQPITDDLDTYDADFQHRLPLGSNQTVVWGLGYRLTHDTVQNAANTAFLPAQVDHQLFSVFLQDEIQLAPSVALTLGSKLEHTDYTGLEAEPSVRLRWIPAHDHMLWSAVSRAVRMPSRYDRDIFQPRPPPLVASGNKNFKSETLVAYEAGYRGQLGSTVSVSASAFYNDYDQLRSFGPVPGTLRPVIFGNNLEGHTYGAEFTAAYQVSPVWRARAGYNILREHLRVKAGQIDVFAGKNESSDPEHQFTLGSSFDLPYRISLDLNGRWVDELPTTNGIVPAYSDLDVRLAWNLNDRIELSLVGQNLLHPHHPEFGIAITRREEIQRSIYGKLTLRF
jgi:iron complex outermembrane recepter protein